MPKSYSSIKAGWVNPNIDTTTGERKKKKYNEIKSSDYDFGVDNEYINSFYNDYQKYAKNTEKEYKNVGFKNITELYNNDEKARSELRDRASNIRAYINSRKNNISEEDYNSISSALENFNKYTSSVGAYYKNKKDLFSQFKSEDEYKIAKNTQKYKDYSYDDIQRTIAIKQRRGDDKSEIEWLKNYALTKDYATSADYDKGLNKAIDSINSLSKEKSEIQQRMSGYERGRLQYTDQYKTDKERLSEIDKEIEQAKKTRDSLQSGKILKQKDEELQNEMSVQNNADFADVSSSRDFNNPTREELRKYDVRNDSTSWYVDNNNDYYNAFGEKIGKGKDIEEYYSRYSDSGISDKLGLFLSATDSELNEAVALRGSGDTWANTINEGIDNNWQELNNDEIAIYYYYLNKGEKDNAYKFLSNRAYQLGMRADEKQKAKMEGANALEMIAMNAASVPANVFGGIAAFASDTINTIKGKDINPYDMAHSFVNFAQNTRQETSQRIDNSIDDDFISTLVSNSYQAVMSGADSLLGAATLGSGYTVTMGMGAASQKAQELYENGASRGQIALGSLASGAIEWLTEKASYDFIVDKLWKNPKSGKDLIKALLASAGNEGIEEVNSDVLNLISDSVIQGYNSVSERTVREIMNTSGVSEEEARRQVAAQNAIDIFWSGYGGFISGGLLAGGGLALNLGQSALQNAAYNKAYKQQSGENIVNNSNVDSLVEVARSLDDSKANAKVKALAEEIANTDTSGLSESEQEAFSNRVGKLYSEVQKAQERAYQASDKTAIKPVIKEKIKDKGITDENVINKAADAIYKTVYDSGSLSSSEENLIKHYKLESVANELINDNGDIAAKGEKATKQARNMYLETAELADNKPSRQIDTSSYELSDDGKTYRKDSGEEVKITGVSTIKNGKMTVNLSDGSSTSLDNISLGSNDEAILYEGVLEMGVSAASAQMIIKSYNPSLGMNALNYIRGVQDAVKYGKIGGKAFLNDGVFTSALPEKLRNDMYHIGEIEEDINARNKNKAIEKLIKNNKGSKKVVGTVTFKGVNRDNLNEMQKVSVNAVETVFGEMGINVVFFQSPTNKNGEHIGKNGSYDPSTNTVTLDIFAGAKGQDTILFTAAHELTHFIKEWSPLKFRKFANFLIENYAKHGQSIEELIRKKIASSKKSFTYSKPLTYDQAFEEVVADSCETFLRDSRLTEKLTELAKADMTLFERIKLYINDLLEKLKKAYAGLTPDSREGKIVLDMKDCIEELHNMWEEAALDARNNFQSAGGKSLRGSKNTADEGGVKNSQREKIYPNMSDSERADIIRNTTIDVVEFKDDKAELSGKQVLKLKSTYKSEAQKILKELAEKFGVFKDYSNDSIELEFNYSRGSLNESTHKQNERNADFYDFAKMLYIFDDVIKNAQPIESHTDKYRETKRENKNINQVFVLLSAFRDGNYIIPVEFNIKEFNKGVKNQLYVSVTLKKIEADLMETLSNQKSSVGISKSTSNYSITELIKNVNPADEEFLKYIPDELLSDEQKQGKSNAVKREKLRIDDLKYEHAVKNNPEKARQMLTEAAKQNGYSNDTDWRMDHKAPNADDETAHNIAELDKAYGGDGSLYSPQAVYYYGEGRSYDNKAIQIIRSVRNKPNAMVKIYRAVPTSIKDTRVRNGDWVAIVKDYAVEHAERILDGKYRIIENTVPAKFLFNNGDSINEFGYDNGNRNEVYKNTAANVKLDEITYDDNGNLIPLSERFNTENSDTRYSDRDYSYETLVSKPDMRLTVLSGNVPNNRAGVIYNARKNAAIIGKFNTKDGSVSVHVDDINIDVVLSTNGLKHGLDRRFDTNAPVTLKAGEILQHSIKINELTPKKEEADNSYVLIGAAKKGEDELYIVQSVINKFSNELLSMDVLYAINAKKENRLRSMRPGARHPVTDSTISISKLLDYVNKYFPDILPESVLKHFGHTERPEGVLGESALFSDRDPDAVKAYSEINKQLTKENQELKEDVEKLKELSKLQKQLTHGKMFTKSSIDAEANVLMNYVSAKGEKSELISCLNDLYSYIANGEELSWEGIKEKAAPVVNWLQEHEYHKPQRDEYANEVLKHLRTLRVSLNDEQKQEVASVYGSYNEFRKKNMGRIIFTDDGTPLDTQWQELAKMYPAFFDSGITAENQPIELMDIIYNLQSSNINGDYYFADEMAAQDLLVKVYEGYWNLSTLHTFADVKQKEINLLKAKHNDRISALRKAHNEKDAKLKQEYTEKTARLRKWYRDREAAKLKDISERYQESRKKSIEGRKKTEMRHKIKNVIKELNNILNHGTKERNVKEELKNTVSSALSAADLLFTPSVSNEDIIRGGIENVTSSESKIVKEYSDLLEKRDMYNDKIEHLSDMQITADRSQTIFGYQKMVEYIDKNILVLDRKLRGLFERERSRINKAPVSAAIDALANAYASLKDSKTEYIKNVYSDFMYQRITALKDSIGGTLIKDMNIYQMSELCDAYTMVLNIVRKANTFFADGKKITISESAETAAKEIYETGGAKEKRLAITEPLRKFGWQSLKPIYAFRTIGSKVLTDLYNNVRKGEDIWYRDVEEARRFRRMVNKKYGYSDWNLGKKYDFESRTGKKFSLSLDQIMQFYAYSRREQALNHLTQGGFVFDSAIEVIEKNKYKIPLKYRVNTADAYSLSPEIIGNIVDTLSPEQKAYVEEMQAYLSDVMGSKGNEVSMAMYGINLFKENYYFPIKSADQYQNYKPDDMGEFKLRNSAFTNETNKFANNPIIITGFTDIWGKHVNDMSMYHAFVLPLEDFMRVFNYRTPSSEQMDTRSVKATLQNAYGRESEEYIRELIRDLNGGLRSQGGAEIVNKLISLSKKGAVFASASVTIQQPTSVARAMAYIKPKYFVETVNKSFNVKNHNSDWEELKKYAPIAGIKEMGYFDTGMGQSSVDWIISDEYEDLKEKIGAFFKDGDYRDEILSKAPSLADEIGWVQIWHAVKREVADNSKLELNSEEFFNKCGERFTEVVTLTQVYDSVFSRSGLMRSKDTGVKMATAFMAEPTTTMNMVFDAIVQGKRTGNKKFVCGVIGAVAGSIVLNALVKALATAGRDDDDDETYLEKYLADVFGDLVDNVRPLNYIPWAKDIVSIFQGYDVERLDMTLISDLKKAIDRLNSDNYSTYEKVSGVIGAVAAIFGLPIKNIERDIRATITTFKTLTSGNKNTKYGIEEAIREGVIGKETSLKERAETAFNRGDTATVKKIISDMTDQKVKSGKTQKEAKSAVRASLTSTYKPKYIKAYKKGDEKGKSRIRSFLYYTGIYGSLSEVDSTLAKWLKDSEDE